MAKHLDLGKQGELVAKEFLEDQGYVILDTNWRFHHKELDLIAQDGDVLVIVEVKTRKSDQFGNPEMAVSRDKQKMIIRSANAYVHSKQWKGETRFDIISVILNQEDCSINHIPDAFGLTGQ